MPTAGLRGVRERVRNAPCRPLWGQRTGEKCPLQASSANHSPCGQAEITSAIHIHRNNLEGIFQVLSSITNGDVTLNHGATLFPHAVIHKIGVIRLPLLCRLGGHGDLERSCRREQRCAGPSVAPPRAAPHSPSPADLPPPRDAGSHHCSFAEPQPTDGQNVFTSDSHRMGLTPSHV